MAGKTLRFFKKRFRFLGFLDFLGFLGFNVRTVARGILEYDQEGLYTKIN